MCLAGGLIYKPAKINLTPAFAWFNFVSVDEELKVLLISYLGIYISFLEVYDNRYL